MIILPVSIPDNNFRAAFIELFIVVCIIISISGPGVAAATKPIKKSSRLIKKF